MKKIQPVILCVDDEPMNLTLLDAILTPLGFKTIKTNNGLEALTMIQKNNVDCVLLDVMMPQMSGYEVCKLIKEDERYRHIPVIMITSLISKEDRIKSIECGADDFISKPFDKMEVISRINMLLKVKQLNDDLRYAYGKIINHIIASDNIFKNYNPFNYDFFNALHYLIQQLIRESPVNIGKPEYIVVGFNDKGKWQWYKYSKILGEKLIIERNKLQVIANLSTYEMPVTIKYNKGETIPTNYRFIFDLLDANNLEVYNLIAYIRNDLCFIAINYDKDVSDYDVNVLHSIIMQTLYLRTIAVQVTETNSAYTYTVYTLARASEVNDEDTGNHILRVGEYSATLAHALGLGDNFVTEIRTQAIIHDIGKIHIPPSILKKPDKLTNEEFEEMKQHPVYGAKIIGDHPKFVLGKEIILCHHEKWDGSGYPKGLKGEEIPISARIATIADQYDALRNKRLYKPAFDHEKTVSILVNGDGRSLPCHFDPKIIETFKQVAPKFEEIHEKLKG